MKTIPKEKKPSSNIKNQHAHFRVLLSSNEDGISRCEITLPFPPFVGLHIELPIENGDFVQVTSVFYMQSKGCFDVGYDDPTLPELQNPSHLLEEVITAKLDAHAADIGMPSIELRRLCTRAGIAQLENGGLTIAAVSKLQSA